MRKSVHVFHANAAKSAKPPPDTLEVQVRPAATLVLLRDAPSKDEASSVLQVLLLRRTPKAGFAANAYVFPGGAVDVHDCTPNAARLSTLSQGQAGKALGLTAHHEALGYYLCAIRETFEEALILVGSKKHRGTQPDVVVLREAREQMQNGKVDFFSWLQKQDLMLHAKDLVYFSHWITPKGSSRRFDTRFFACRAPSTAAVEVDNGEMLASWWTTPAQALDALKERRIEMMHPTAATLRLLLQHQTVKDALQNLAQQPKGPVLPKRVTTPQGEMRVLMPWDKDYENA